jgi:hypothetical protein
LWITVDRLERLALLLSMIDRPEVDKWLASMTRKLDRSLASMTGASRLRRPLKLSAARLGLFAGVLRTASSRLMSALSLVASSGVSCWRRLVSLPLKVDKLLASMTHKVDRKLDKRLRKVDKSLSCLTLRRSRLERPRIARIII